MRVEYHPLTASDLNSAIAHYNEWRQGLGNELRAEAYAAIDRIVQNPHQFSIIERDIRRCLVHRFPYSILFRIIGTQNSADTHHPSPSAPSTTWLEQAIEDPQASPQPRRSLQRLALKPSCVLDECALPRYRHREKKSVKPRIFEAFADVASRSEEKAFLLIRDVFELCLHFVSFLRGHASLENDQVARERAELVIVSVIMLSW